MTQSDEKAIVSHCQAVVRAAFSINNKSLSGGDLPSAIASLRATLIAGATVSKAAGTCTTPNAADRSVSAEDDASEILALAKSFGLAGFTTDPRALQTEDELPGESDDDDEESADSDDDADSADDIVALGKSFSLKGFVD